MDPINVEDAPTRAVQLAAGELALRVAEERRRRVVGLAGMPQLQARPMIGKPGVIYSGQVIANVVLQASRNITLRIAYTSNTACNGCFFEPLLDVNMSSVAHFLHRPASKQGSLMVESSVMARLQVTC